MATVSLTPQQSLRIAELPAAYRVVGLDQTAPLVRKPSGQLLRIRPDGRLVTAAGEAKRRLAEQRSGQASPLLHGPVFATLYTEVQE